MPTSQPVPRPLLDTSEPWQMGYGERAALVGLLADLRPEVAIEIGTAEGGSLRQIARYAGHVHSFDMLEPEAVARGLDNVTFHTGDSHELLPRLLAELGADGTNVGFVLVDGDHSAEGVARDMRDLLGSAAIRRTAIVMHDTMNEQVRSGLEAVDYDAWPKVRHVELDFVAGFHFRAPLEGELWGGLGLAVVDEDDPRPAGRPARQQRYHDTHGQVLLARRLVAARERVTRVRGRLGRRLAALRRG